MSVGKFSSAAAKFLNPQQQKTPKKLVKRLHKKGKENRHTRQAKTTKKHPRRNMKKKNYANRGL